MMCMLGVPIAGIAGIGAVSVRQFFLGDGEPVGFASLDDEFAPVSLPDAARNRAPEVTMAEPVEDDLNETIERLTELRSTG